MLAMTVILAVLSGLAFLMALVLYSAAKTAFHEISAALFLVIWAVLFVGAGMCGGLHSLIITLAVPKPSASDDPPSPESIVHGSDIGETGPPQPRSLFSKPRRFE